MERQKKVIVDKVDPIRRSTAKFLVSWSYLRSKKQAAASVKSNHLGKTYEFLAPGS